MLTEKQHQTLEFIKEYISQFGYAPTTAEIALGISIKSRANTSSNNSRATPLPPGVWSITSTILLIFEWLSIGQTENPQDWITL